MNRNFHKMGQPLPERSFWKGLAHFMEKNTSHELIIGHARNGIGCNEVRNMQRPNPITITYTPLATNINDQIELANKSKEMVLDFILKKIISKASE